MRAFAWLLFAASHAVAHGGAAAADPDDQAFAFADRFAATEAEIRALPEADLKKFYLNCSREAIRGRIGSGEIQLCSIGYERLLQGSFGGDFRAFLDWRRDAVRRPEPSRPNAI